MPDERTERSESYLSKRNIHEQWKEAYLSSDRDPFYDAAFRRIVQLLGAPPGSTILDAGCGYGFHAARLARQGLKVVGIDFSEAALEQARAYIQQEGLASQVELRQGNLLALPFPDASFSYVNCWGVLMHVPDIEKALSELARVLQPNGRLAIGENNAWSLHVQVWERVLRLLKRSLGRATPTVRRVASGREEWLATDTGGLLVRKTDMAWLEATARKLGLRLVHRQAGEFTELYTSLPGRVPKRLVMKFNEWWFAHVRRAGPALGNVLIL